MATRQLKPRNETNTQDRPARENGRRETRDRRWEQVVGIVVLVLMFALFILAVVLAGTYGEPTELDHIDYWMMP